MKKMNKNEIILDKEYLPRNYYNILADLPFQLNPPKGNLEMLGRIFPKALLEQEMSSKKFIQIPEELLELYSKIGRPTPLYRASRLEKALGTPAKIYFKREDSTFSGSHKINTALAQAYYNKLEGIESLSTETGAGQWGSALSLACALFDLKCKVFMVKASFQQKPYRKHLMNFFGAEVIASPSNETEFGRKMLKESPECPGSLGIAISEAIEVALKDDKTNYSLGSVLNHVLLHQTIIGQEALKQFDSIDEFPDQVVACVGGGSNFAGLSFPFIEKILSKKKKIEVIAVEPNEVPSLTKGEFKYDFGDTAGLTPQMEMYSLGSDFIPEPIYAGGLRYHGMAPIVSALKHEGIISASAHSQKECFDAAQKFALTEGIIPAPESSHAIKEAIDQAMKAKQCREEKTILFNLSGHGLLDLEGYAKELKFR